MQEQNQNTQENNGQDLIQSETEQNLAEQTQNLEQDSMPLYTSPILLLSGIALNPMPICVECPKAMWHIASKAQEKTIRCFCQVMHSITYQAIHIQGQNPSSKMMIEQCDGQLAAIQELVESE